MRCLHIANDIQIAFGIMAILVFIGVMLPYVQAEFGDPVITTNASNIESGIQQKNLSQTSIFSIVVSVASMLFWYSSLLPFYLNMVFIVLKITMWLIIARNIWIGGGA